VQVKHLPQTKQYKTSINSLNLKHRQGKFGLPWQGGCVTTILT